jgi:polar amino acid transport system substrate-binding protein
VLKQGLSAVAGLLLAAGAAQAGSLPSLYTAAQATSGAAIYVQNCAMCHGADLKGGAGPTLIGQAFASPGAAATIGGIFSVIAQQMPASAPGSLTPTQDEDAMAYLLKVNGYPAGTAPLVYKNSIASTVPFISQVK